MSDLPIPHMPSPPTGAKKLYEEARIITPPASIVTPTNPVTEARTMSFPDAMRRVIDGRRVRRIAWGDVPDYAYLRDGWLTLLRDETFHTWSINDGDLLANDWVVID